MTTNRPRAADLRTSIDNLLNADKTDELSLHFRNAMIAIFNDDRPDYSDYTDLATIAAMTHLISILETINANLTFRLCDIFPDMPDATESHISEEMTELRTELALADSLCPIHFIDYAICFDDANPECEIIRAIHPSHDT